jgi:hypothetical protein
MSAPLERITQKSGTSTARWRSRFPLDAREPSCLAKLADISGHERGSEPASMSRDKEVERADDNAPFFEVNA